MAENAFVVEVTCKIHLSYQADLPLLRTLFAIRHKP